MSTESRGFRFRVLGRLEASRNGADLTPNAKRRREILQRMILEVGRPVSVDTLSEMLWADHLPADPKGAVRTHVSYLRDDLDPEREMGREDLIRTEGDSYLLTVDEISVDARQFSRTVEESKRLEASEPDEALKACQTALELWRGIPYQEVDFADFETERARLNEIRVTAANLVAKLLLDANRNEEVVASLRPLSDEYPLNERLRRLLMMALHRQGRSAEAMRESQEFREELGELGLEPSTDLIELEGQILGHDPVLVARGTGETAVTPSRNARRVATLLVRLADAEAWQAALGDGYPAVERYFLATVESVAVQHGGTVYQKWGDRALAVFGFDSGIESNADLACQAALDVHTALRERSAPIAPGVDRQIMARSFVHRGVVEVESSASRLADVEGMLMSDLDKIERLSDARPGETIATHSAISPVADFYSATDLEPVESGDRTFPLMRIDKRTVTRSPRRYPSLGVPMIGRERELDLLRDHWMAASDGHASLLLLSGVAGIGKTRLLEEWKHDVRSNRSHWLSGATSEIHPDTPFYLFADLIETHLREFDIKPSEPGLASAHTGIPASSLGFLLDQSGAVEEGPGTSEIRGQLISDVASWIRRLAADRPTAMVLEDIHWADPSSLELLNEIVEEPNDLRLLVVATRRPPDTDGGARAQRLPRAEIIELERLPDREAEELARVVADLFDIATTPDNLSDCGGNPLFVQEIVRGEGRTLTDHVYPVLSARLQACGLARRAAETASVLGTSFNNQVLYSLAPELPLEDWTSTLIDLGIFEPVDETFDAVSRFTHSLVTMAAYELLDKDRKVHLHRKAAASVPASVSFRHPEVVARHLTAVCTHSADPRQEDLISAAEAWLAAGRKATAQSAYSEALNYLDGEYKAGYLISLVTDANVREKLLYQLHEAKAAPLEATEGFAARAVEDNYRALSTGTQLSDIDDFAELRGLAAVHLLRADLDEAVQFSLRALEKAKTTEDPVSLAEANAWAGTAMFFVGDHDEAERYLTDEIFDEDVDELRVEGPKFGLDPVILARSHRAWLLHHRGHDLEAISLSGTTTQDAFNLNHPLSKSHSLLYESGLRVFRGENEAALTISSKQVELAKDHGFPHYLHYGQLINWYARAQSGKANDLYEVVAAMDHALEERSRKEARLARPFHLWLIGRVELLRGNESGALDRFREAHDVATRTKEIWYLPTIEDSIG